MAAAWLSVPCVQKQFAGMHRKDLPAWHPLVTGRPASTRRAGHSVLKPGQAVTGRRWGNKTDSNAAMATRPDDIHKQASRP